MTTEIIKLESCDVCGCGGPDIHLHKKLSLPALGMSRRLPNTEDVMFITIDLCDECLRKCTNLFIPTEIISTRPLRGDVVVLDKNPHL